MSGKSMLMAAAGANKNGPTIGVATLVAGQNDLYIGYDQTGLSTPAIGSVTPQNFTAEGVPEAFVYMSITTAVDTGVWDIWLNSTTYNATSHSWLTANCKFFWLDGVKHTITWGPYDPTNKTYYVVDPSPTWTPALVNGQTYKVGFSKT